MRLLATLLVLVAHILVLAPAAHAEQVAVVVDRGRGAEADAEAWIAEATALVTTLRERGLDTHLYVYGTRPSGRIRAAELKGNPARALATASTREGWQFEGPTDPRQALHTAVRRNRSEEALLVFLVGPFEGEADDAAETQAEEALATWNVRAPVGSRGFAVGMGTARQALVAQAEGWVGDGTIVLGAGEATVEAAPFSPLSEAPLRATVQIPVVILTIGQGASAPWLLADSARDGDRLRFLTDTEAPAAQFDLERTQTDDRVATLAFRNPDHPSVLWFTDVPEPKTFQWTDLAPDARLETPGSPQVLPFEVRNGRAGQAYERTYWIVRSRTDPAPVWTSAARGAEGPAEVEVDIGAERARDDTTTVLEVKVAFTPTAGRALDASGALVLSSEGYPRQFEIPFLIEVPPGRVTVRLEAPTAPRPLPPGKDDAPFTVVVEPENENLPSHVRVVAVVEPRDAGASLVATLESRGGGVGVTWDLAQPVDLRAGATYDLGLTLAEGVRAVDAEIALTLVPTEGVEGRTEGRGRVVGRHPKMVLENRAYAYRVEDKQIVGDPPLVVRLDPDGGGGRWLASLREAPPSVRSHPDSPVLWSLRLDRVDRWILEATGSWRGDRGYVFSGHKEMSELSIDWQAGEAPGALRVDVEVPPRWGSAGWILVVLAGMAVLLAAWGVTQLRPVPLEGTLLYTVEGRERAVGRLDLAGAGRRTVALRADAEGLLSLGGTGDAIAMLRPTRVGGMLVAAGASGPLAEHLLVDGLTVRVAGHRLRYVSGRPNDSAPPVVELPEGELLGPEFDLATGRIEALGENDDADDAPVRS